VSVGTEITIRAIFSAVGIVRAKLLLVFLIIIVLFHKGMREETVVPVGAFLILFDEVAHLRMIIVSISFSIFGIVIIHAMFVVMSLGNIAGSHFKDF
jgi:hypothetical protein